MHETDEELGSLAKRYGPKRAARIWKLSRSASRDLIATLRRLRISCDLEECATIYWTSDRRLLLGGNDRPVAAPARRRQAFDAGTRKLRQYFETLLPALTDVEIELAWEGLFAITPDGLPYIGPHRRYPRHLFALGYGGNGMTFGFLAARLLLDAVRDVPNRDLQLFAFNRMR